MKAKPTKRQQKRKREALSRALDKLVKEVGDIVDVSICGLRSNKYKVTRKTKKGIRLSPIHCADTRCTICTNGVEYYRKWEAEMLSKCGFIIHMVLPTGGSKWMNYHTHGMPEHFDHQDLQIVFPVSEEQCQSYMWAIIDKIKDGAKYKPGDSDSRILTLVGTEEPIPVEFSAAVECGRNVLRVLIPDKKGRPPSDKLCEFPYSGQANAVVA